MDIKSHLEAREEQVIADPTRLLVGSLLLPTEEYSTSLSIFPGTCAYPWFNLEGEFGMTVSVFNSNSTPTVYRSEYCNEQGNIRVELDSLGIEKAPGLFRYVLIELSQTQKIPVDIYLSAVHRETGVYISYPGLVFIGDQIFSDLHSNHLENTTFWPGLVSAGDAEVCTAILNPYNEPFFYQIHMIHGDGVRLQSKSFKIAKKSCSFKSLKDVFGSDFLNLPPATSICITSQFKHVGYVAFRDTKAGIFTSLDHTHTYQMV